MFNTTLTIGFNDKIEEKQIISSEDAKQIIAKDLLNNGIFAFTMWDCKGVYQMNSTGNIIQESSVKIEILTDGEIENLSEIIETLKADLNQESIMIQKRIEDVEFA